PGEQSDRGEQQAVAQVRGVLAVFFEGRVRDLLVVRVVLDLHAVTATAAWYAPRSAPDCRYAFASAVARGMSYARMASSSSTSSAAGVRPDASNDAQSRSSTDVTSLLARAASLTKFAMRYSTRAR